MALMLVIIWAQSIISIYALVNPFIDEMGNMQHYNMAYYGAIAGVERAELALRWHTAWFEWSWWWINKKTYGPDSDHKSECIDRKYFWLLALTWLKYWVFWNIKSMSDTNVIPNTWQWDLDQDISSGNDYYRLSFDRSIQLALYYDKTGKGTINCNSLSDYYTWVDETNCIEDIKLNWLKASMRVPQRLYNKYNKISNKNKQLDIDNDSDWNDVKNDIVVNRSLFWLTWDNQFTIFPTKDIANDWTVKNDDTNIREDVINAYDNNNPYNIKFDSTSKDTNPNKGWNHTQNVDKFNQSPEDAVSTWFDVVLWSNSTKKMHAKFSLVNLLRYDPNRWYPYLEIQIKANPDNEVNQKIPDVFYHIKWEWKVGAYDVRIKINKPVFDVDAASDFTVIF